MPRKKRSKYETTAQARKLFIHGMAEQIAWSRGEPLSIIIMSAKPRTQVISSKNLAMAQVLWDFLQEQGYTLEHIREHLADTKIPIVAMGRLVTNWAVLGGRYWLLRRTNKQKYIVVEQSLPVYDLTHSFGFDLRAGEEVEFFTRRPMLPLVKILRNRLDTDYLITVGVEEESFWWGGVLQQPTGFYYVMKSALPAPVPDASFLKNIAKNAR